MAAFERSKYAASLARLCDGTRTSLEVADLIGCNTEMVKRFVRDVPGASLKLRDYIRRNGHTGWTEERVAKLRQMWEEGLSASLIAGRLGGVTRNAVIGKVHRLKLPARIVTANRDRYKAHLPRTPKPNKIKYPKPAGNPVFRKLLAEAEKHVEPVEEVVIPEAERKTLQDLEPHNCRWPIGDPQEKDFHFCARKKVNGLAYCAHHAKRAYEAPRPRRSRVQKPYIIDNSKQFESV